MMDAVKNASNRSTFGQFGTLFRTLLVKQTVNRCFSLLCFIFTITMTSVLVVAINFISFCHLYQLPHFKILYLTSR